MNLSKMKAMGFKLLYPVVFLIGLTSFTMMVSNAPAQEELLKGDWKEIKWSYEKQEGKESSKVYHIGKQDSVAGEQYRIHHAETWKFKEGGELKLLCRDECILANWSIKGRGHILQIRYNDNYVENYQLAELEKDSMVLNYECNAQAKGIAKLNFKKVKG